MEHKAEELVNMLRTQLEEKDTKIEELVILLEQAQEEAEALREPSIDSYDEP